MGAEPLREHLLLLIEKCDRYDEFRVELETLARVKSAGQMSSALMDLSVYEVERHIRHKAPVCWQKQEQEQPHQQDH